VIDLKVQLLKVMKMKVNCSSNKRIICGVQAILYAIAFAVIASSIGLSDILLELVK